MTALTEKQRLKALGEQEFPKYLWYFYACVIAAAAMVNLCSMIWAWWRRRKYSSMTTSTITLRKGVVSSNRMPAAIISATRIVAFRWRIPSVDMTLLEVLLTITFMVIYFCFEWTNTLHYDDGLWGNRAGHLAAIQFPLIVALSGKNNIIGMITGLGHEKLNLMHRVVSRIVLIMVWTHLVGTYFHWQTGGHRDERPWIYASWIVAGLIACICYTFLVFLSWGPIRRRFYERFYVMHMVLVTVIMICAMYHIHTDDVVNTVYASPYFWPSFIAWGIDRIARLVRVLLLNSVFKLPKDLGQVALVTSDTLLITIKRHVPRGLTWRSGQHMFVAFPTLGPGQSHPFTIASVVERDAREQELVFIARVREGFTRCLKDHVLEVGGACDVPIILDGPYGSPPDITPFSTCVFIAGGSGVTFTLPRFEDLVNELQKNHACASRITFIWAINERAHMRWIAKRLTEITSLVPSHVTLTVSIFVTSSPSPSRDSFESPPSTPTSEEDVEKKAVADDSDESVSDLEEKLDRVSVSYGRPDIKKILELEVDVSQGPVSVDVSGPQSLIAATRSALVSTFAGPLGVLKGAPTVQLNVEAFSM
ncbi:hypothetical protein EUX98_g1465 [Antrodiella citrinella]|uniref:ferric-chelate reductase (NADPH) n=1 Tax=Antrodiella citrinella TaxID=2447956 RepID=A0A4S4N1H0_9APHY|nr:hypothetical protein EUX98_g1465 [Antrodiella citrinella]